MFRSTRGHVVLLIQLLSTITWEHRNIALANYVIKSTFIVKDPAGNDVGPRIELSDTVLKTNQVLKYICREGTSAERNTISKVTGASLTPVDRNEQSNIQGRVCNYAVDTDFWCTVNTGDITWKKSLGGRYACSAYPEESYLIHWIDPVALVPQSTDFSRDVYGSNLRFYCSVDMTPTDISYSKIMSVVWHWNSAKTQGNWVILQNNINGVKYQTDSFGANSTLVISNYNPIQHGGEYRCTVNILRYADPLESTPFSIQSQPRAQLTNDKRDSFDFGVTEEFSITCYAESYPFPSDIQFRIYTKTLTRDHPGIKDFYVDTLTLNVERHYATFTVTNATSVFPVNNSVIECIVTRPDGEMHPAQERVSLFEVTPPVTATDSPVNPNVRPRQEPTRPWVIAIAVIIPIIILLVIAVILVWKCKRFGGGEDDGGNFYHAPSDDNITDGQYADHRSVRSMRSSRYSDSQSMTSQGVYAPGQYIRGQHNKSYNSSPYATPGRVDHNPIYGGSQYSKGRRADPPSHSQPLTEHPSKDHFSVADEGETPYRPPSVQYSTPRSNRAHAGYASPPSLNRY